MDMSWRKITTFVCVLVCLQQMGSSQLVDEDMLQYLQFMNYMTSMSRDTTSMARTIPRVARAIDPSFVASIVRDVLTALNRQWPSPGASPPPVTPPITPLFPDINAASELPNIQITQPRGDVAPPNFSPSWFDINNGFVSI